MTPTLGFASNLSHTIIRETQEDDDHSTKSHDTDSTDISISDEELALLGPPWAKEGMLCRKQFWEATGKKARARSWMDVFVVIQRGEVNMFTFGDRGGGGSGVVGGGNWLVIALFFSTADHPDRENRKTRNQSARCIWPIHWPTRFLLLDTTDNAHTVWY